MAQMHPEAIEKYPQATPGEKMFFRFIGEAAKPDKDFICWYEPALGVSGKVPDFVLFGKTLGLVVFEVKDWKNKQIISYDPHQFTILTNGHQEERTNPYRQAKGYVDTLLEELRKNSEFRADELGYGKVKIPISRMVVFPYLKQGEYSDRNLHYLIPRERVLLEEDLTPAGEFLVDNSGKRLLEFLESPMPFRFTGLKLKGIKRLSKILWPVSKIALPVRAGSGKSKFQDEVRWLDQFQERISIGLGNGHRIIKGPPGSGKTLVIAHRCQHLFMYSPKTRRILIVCYNIALTSYLKRLLMEKGVGIGPEGIEVHHFYDLCGKILDETIHFEKEDSDYYDLVIEETIEKVKDGSSGLGKFDAILIDEGQDFNDQMLSVLLGLLKPSGDLVIALDSFQDLYMRKRSWKSLGIKAAGRTKQLRNVYRNTSEIFSFAEGFVGKVKKNGKQLALPFDSSLHGEQPSLKQFESHQKMEAFIVDDLKESLENRSYIKSEVAIIYDDKIYDSAGFVYGNRGLPERLVHRLENSGIAATWVSQDVRSKETYDVTTDRVSIISIHSSKGLDFDLVYLVGMDNFHVTDHTRNALLSLVYVAITRAKFRLIIPYVVENEILIRMKACSGI